MSLPVSHKAKTSSEESTPPSQESAPAKRRLQWFHIRWRTLLVLPLALLVVTLFLAPRQLAQRNAIVKLKEMGAVMQTGPLLIPGVSQIVGDEYAQNLLDVYIKNPTITEKQLGFLSSIPTLQKLELGGSSVASIDFLRGRSSLYTLHLSRTKITDDGLDGIETLSGLRILSLNSTDISSRGLERVGKLTKLERLMLDDTRITDDAISHLTGLSSLKELTCVNAVELTDACLPHLKQLKSLEILKLFNTKITPEGLQELQKALPQCVVWIPED